ncbi:cancer-associated 1 protein-like isoform X2 [Clarias magur]|uniref:Cancer-associated 1 protein-like isoform X2 n=1 Tax=Clarias magur TaxID=1594786 RepID=A0A8J4U3B7_CLAMG|nr:cancer-associated 1 protein-like isoform X2 [Clarias magur]
MKTSIDSGRRDNVNSFPENKQRVVLKNAAEAVFVPLKDGVSSLNRVYETLIEANDPVTGQCFNYDYIRQQAVQAHQHLERSGHIASSGLKSLDEDLARLLQDEGKLEQEQRRAETHLANLRAQQVSNESLQRSAQGALERAEKHLDSTKQDIQSQKRKKRRAKILRGVGMGLLAAPVAGWVAGAALVTDVVNRRRQASRATVDPEDEVRRYDAEVRNYERRVYEYQFRISQACDDITQNDRKLTQTREAIHEVRKKSDSVAELQRKMRSAVQVLEALSGKASMAEHRTRSFILQEPVMKVMEDVMKAMEQNAGNGLLYNKDLPRIMHELKENHQLLETICASEKNITL